MDELSFPKRSTPSFMRLLNTNRDLLDAFSICRVLTTDLYGAKYLAPPPEEVNVGSVDSVESDAEYTRVEKKRRVRNSNASSGSKQISNSPPKKSLKELYEGDSDLDDTEIRQGFMDDQGEEFYIIEKVLRYHPDKGYFVHWKGYPKSERTWQNPGDMPSGFLKEMKRARERYEKEKLFAS